MRGLKDGAVARKPVQHFLMSVVRLKTLFWEIERRKTSLPWSSHTARNRSDFNIRHLSTNFNGRSVTGLTPFLCPAKGFEVGSNEGLKDGAGKEKEARPTFPDVRGQLKTLFWEIERRKTSLWSSHTARNRSDFNIRHLSN
ncbi:hypothetical protein TNIN_70571 [Trichonephila inaurata madagascariensis]|uniref:Uncharacterized protein n=1 Tax=Trichonephila inaurata madagascariensis TaxID=2747483 RepID=A0A8X6YA91_9ARAC|nr:hypothetical protein TNIN_70571 [Trichonephila inaurata madagascariensis]